MWNLRVIFGNLRLKLYPLITPLARLLLRSRQRYNGPQSRHPHPPSAQCEAAVGGGRRRDKIKIENFPDHFLVQTRTDKRETWSQVTPGVCAVNRRPWPGPARSCQAGPGVTVSCSTVPNCPRDETNNFGTNHNLNIFLV